MAVESKTDICNLALDLLSGSTVLDIDAPTNTNEELLERWYDQCRRQVLREHPWNFAAKRAILAASSTAPLFGYTAAFPFPNDFIRLLTVESDESVIIRPENYQIESHEGVKSLLMSVDASTARIRYVYDIEDVTKFDAMFISYLAMTIALATAYKITESNGSVERIAQLQKDYASMAKAISGQERPPTRIERSRNKTARLSGSNNNPHRLIF